MTRVAEGHTAYEAATTLLGFVWWSYSVGFWGWGSSAPANEVQSRLIPPNLRTIRRVLLSTGGNPGDSDQWCPDRAGGVDGLSGSA